VSEGESPRSYWAIGVALLLVAMFAAAGWFLSRPNVTAEPGQGVAVRIVSMAPSVTEWLFELGAGPRVVGVSEFTEFPPQTSGLPRLGGHLDPNVEQLAALRPDLILTMGSLPRVSENAEQLGIEVVEVPMDTLPQVLDGIERIGRAVGLESEAVEARQELERELAVLAAQVELGRRPTVLLVVGRNPGTLSGLYAAGPRAYLSEVLEVAGGHNALQGEEALWPAVSAERLVRTAPEVIVEFLPRTSMTDAERRAHLEVWRRDMPTLPAVRRGALFVLDHPGGLIPGTRILEVTAALAALVRESKRLENY